MKTPKTDAEWEAQGDAETLARAAEIQADKKRLKRAAKAAKSMVSDAQTRAKAMKRIAKKAPAKRKAASRKTTTRRRKK